MPRLRGQHNLPMLWFLDQAQRESGSVTPEGGRYFPEGVASDDPRDRTRTRRQHSQGRVRRRLRKRRRDDRV